LLPKQPSIHDFSSMVAAIGGHRVNTSMTVSSHGPSAKVVSARAPQADQYPAEWLPPASDQYCRYISEWIGTKLSRRQGRGRPSRAQHPAAVTLALPGR
jgi:hypothetical protein